MELFLRHVDYLLLHRVARGKRPPDVESLHHHIRVVCPRRTAVLIILCNSQRAVQRCPFKQKTSDSSRTTGLLASRQSYSDTSSSTSFTSHLCHGTSYSVVQITCLCLELFSYPYQTESFNSYPPPRMFCVINVNPLVFNAGYAVHPQASNPLSEVLPINHLVFFHYISKIHVMNRIVHTKLIAFSSTGIPSWSFSTRFIGSTDFRVSIISFLSLTFIYLQSPSGPFLPLLFI